MGFTIHPTTDGAQSDSAALNLRSAVRALMLDEHDQLLLVRFVFPTATVWALPGGGLERDEEPESGLRRELREELGLDAFELGPHIWNREHIIPMTTGHDGQRDQIFLVRVAHFDPVPSLGWEAMRSEHVHEMRWWALDQIAAATQAESVWFAPRSLGVLTTQLLADGIPAAPIETGI